MQRVSMRVDLKGELAHKFKEVKRALGFPTNKSVVIYLINDRYDTIKADPKKECSA